jgi:hypothetical protein
LQTAGILAAGFGASDVEATGVINVLAKSSALSTVLASLIHSRKLVPSELRGGNIRACSRDSTTAGAKVAWVSLLNLFIVSRENSGSSSILFKMF